MMILSISMTASKGIGRTLQSHCRLQLTTWSRSRTYVRAKAMYKTGCKTRPVDLSKQERKGEGGHDDYDGA
jgi:hypothetical protein